MYVPSGWLIAKNHLTDADLNIFNKLSNDDKFLIKDVFSHPIYFIHVVNVLLAIIYV